jgi:hypothetical protein
MCAVRPGIDMAVRAVTLVDLHLQSRLSRCRAIQGTRGGWREMRDAGEDIVSLPTAPVQQQTRNLIKAAQYSERALNLRNDIVNRSDSDPVSFRDLGLSLY